MIQLMIEIINLRQNIQTHRSLGFSFVVNIIILDTLLTFSSLSFLLVSTMEEDSSIS